MAGPETPTSVADLEALVGVELGPTEWRHVDQDRIGSFAEVTEDRQWIHVDPERAAASPFGSTIAHGLLTLALGPGLNDELISFEAFAHTLNYGYDKVRFPAPVPVGSRLRMSLRIAAVTPAGQGVQVAFVQTFEREGGTKPVCVAEALARVMEN